VKECFQKNAGPRSLSYASSNLGVYGIMNCTWLHCRFKFPLLLSEMRLWKDNGMVIFGIVKAMPEFYKIFSISDYNAKNRTARNLF